MGEAADPGGDKVLVVFPWPEGQPDLAAVAERLNAPLAAFDEGFGIILLDPVRSLWSVRAVHDALPAELGEGVWIASDPPIHGFGPDD